MTEIAGYLSGIVALVAFAPYLVTIFRGVTKPERTSWLIWVILDCIALFSQLAKGASYSLILPGVYALGDLSIFLLAFKYGYGVKLLKRDKIALAGAGISLVIWYLTKEATAALFIVIVIDWIGGVLTITKSYEAPGTENATKWILTGIASALAMIAVGSFNIILLVFPISIFVMSFSIVTAIKLGGKKVKHA